MSRERSLLRTLRTVWRGLRQMIYDARDYGKRNPAAERLLGIVERAQARNQPKPKVPPRSPPCTR